jgi:hypothetical protein
MTDGLDARWIEVWQKLIDKCTATALFKETDIYWGENFFVQSYPSCFVCPLPLNDVPADFNHDFTTLDFDIGVVVRNANPKQGYIDMMKHVCTIRDALFADRQLDKTVDKLEIPKVYPNWRAMNTGKEAFWGGLLVKVTIYG